MRDLSKETDVNLLQQAVRLLEHENRSLTQQIAKLVTELAELRNANNPSLEVQLKLEAVEQHLAKMQKMLFGPKSERTKPGTSDGSSDAGAAESDDGGSEGPNKSGPGKSRPSSKRREQLKLPRVTVEHPVPESMMVCSTCGATMIDWVGQQDTSLEVFTLRRAFVMVEHHQKKARCPNGCGAATAPAPRKLFPGARYSIGFTLEVAIDKYLNHLPLARQAKAMVAAGLEMDTQTLWDQLNKLARLLNPLYLSILEYIFRHRVIGADETKWRMMSETERIKHNKNKSWQVWTLAVPDAVYYEIQDGRSLDVAKGILGQYEGVILCDGYVVYKSLAEKQSGKVTLAFCWAHARREFKDIAEFFKSETKVVIDLINDLFEVEREVVGEDEIALQRRACLRNGKSRPIVEKIQQWAKDVKTLPGSGLASAVTYMTNHWSGLTRFLDDPRIPLSNNITERANRDPVLGRKNHYGSRSVRGTEVAAQLYTILETAKLNGVDAYAYLELAVEAALDGQTFPLPHESKDAVAARTAANIERNSKLRDLIALVG